MTSIQEDYSNVLDYLNKTLTIFKSHVQYSQNLAQDCKSLFEIGKTLQKNYENRIQTVKIETTLDEIETSNMTFLGQVSEQPINDFSDDQNEAYKSEPDNSYPTPKVHKLHNVKRKRLEGVLRNLGSTQIEAASNENTLNNEWTDNQVILEDESQLNQTDSHEIIVADNEENQEQLDALEYDELNFPSSSLVNHEDQTSHIDKGEFCGIGTAVLENCKVCFQKFSTKGDLKRHMFIHSGLKAYDCTICDKKNFLTLSTLTNHMRYHCDKPYQCTVCSKKFINNSKIFQTKNILHFFLLLL